MQRTFVIQSNKLVKHSMILNKMVYVQKTYLTNAMNNCNIETPTQQLDRHRFSSANSFIELSRIYYFCSLSRDSVGSLIIGRIYRSGPGSEGTLGKTRLVPSSVDYSKCYFTNQPISPRNASVCFEYWQRLSPSHEGITVIYLGGRVAHCEMSTGSHQILPLNSIRLRLYFRFNLNRCQK